MRWTQEEKSYLKENYAKKISLKIISEKLNRSIRSIHHQAARMNLHRLRLIEKNFSKKEPRKVIDRRYYEKNKKEIYQKRKENRKKLKLEMINLFGGKCSICGYNKCEAALEFHHKEDKEESINNLLKNNSKRRLLKEIKKCILLCANCHRELHHRGP